MKRILSIILALVLAFSLCANSVFADTVITATNADKTSSENKINFVDVDKNTATGQAIYKLVDAGIILGDGDGHFRPNDSIKRAELSKIVNMIFGYTEAATDGFADLKGNEWYYNQVLIAKKAGYIKGYDDNTFGGEKNVTREQACAILCRVAKLYELPIDIQITDHVSEWALKDVKTVIANGQMRLEEGNTFRATVDITRAEFCDAYANFVQPKVELVPEVVTVADSKGKITKATFKIEEKQVNVTLPSTHTLSKSQDLKVTVKTKAGEVVSGISVTVKDKTNATKTAVTDVNGVAVITQAAAGGAGGAGGSGGSGGSGGNGGTTPPPTTDTKPEYTEEEYLEMNATMLTNLKDVAKRLNYVLEENPVYFSSNSDEAKLLSIIQFCMKGTVGNGGREIITKQTIYDDYFQKIDEAKGLYNGLSDKASFRGTLVDGFEDSLTDAEREAGITSTTSLMFLFEIFDIDTSR